MATFGLKLQGYAFQMIPDVSFFDAEKKIAKMFDKDLQIFSNMLVLGYFGRHWQMLLGK